MPLTLLGKKIGMTGLYDESGRYVPVTVLKAGPCHVSQIKTAEHDGYDAVQLAFEDVKPRNSTCSIISHDAKAGVSPKRFHREARLNTEEVDQYVLGQTLGVDLFNDVKYVDVIGTSKGKGFAGGMKRWGFKGQPASHGTERKHRSPGSVGGRAADLGGGRPKKGIRMAGHLGSCRVTTRSLKLIRSDPQNNLLVIKGTVPGPNNGMVMVREAVKLSKNKAKET